MIPRSPNPLLTPLFLLMFLIPVALALVYFNLATEAFHRLGLSAGGATLLVLASLLGSMINIPLTRRKIVVADPRASQLPRTLQWILPVVHYYPPIVTEEILAINVGGAIVPILFSAYLLTLSTTSAEAAIVAVIIVATVAKLFARPQPRVGVTLPAFIAPLVAALSAHALVRAMGADLSSAAPVAYIGGTLGTLIGADLLNLPRILRGSLLGDGSGDTTYVDPAGTNLPATDRAIVSIGGAGVFDGIFLTGIIAPLLA
jgi:uncharacterized membrane protein